MDILHALRSDGISVEEGPLLSTLGSFQLGGAVQVLVQARTPHDMGRIRQRLLEMGLSAPLIGDGTNILFSDAGWDGILVRATGGHCPEPAGQGTTWTVPAMTPLEDLVNEAVRLGLSGLEPFVGIPGTVGGAVVGNAGAWGVQIAERLTRVSGWTPTGDPFSFTPEACGFAYRDSHLKRDGYWVGEVELALTPGNRADLEGERERILGERARRHPEWRSVPCIGSFFKNLEPTSAAGRRQAAGWFLEQAGAKSCRVGGAAVFEKHANILIKAADDCTAADVAALARQLTRQVEESQGISLEREVRYLGAIPGEDAADAFY